MSTQSKGKQLLDEAVFLALLAVAQVQDGSQSYEHGNETGSAAESDVETERRRWSRLLGRLVAPADVLVNHRVVVQNYFLL